jgi:hypothetical protein
MWRGRFLAIASAESRRCGFWIFDNLPKVVFGVERQNFGTT